ncbi:MAG: type II secretion system protein [Cyanobacterium sp. T60_A2020_053]|nr:type II secretion system protein [Cyanobacterium sp. T60_A2020_053]
MRRLIVLNKLSQEKGFNLIELLVITIIIGVATALGTPSLVGARRQEITNQAFNEIKGALIEAQVNANRLSGSCTVLISSTQVLSYLHVDDDSNPNTDSTDDDGTVGVLDPRPTSNPTSCTLETINIDDNVVSVTSTSGGVITYSFRGTTSDAQTIWIARKNFNGIALNDTAKCVVVSTIGMIRTGVVANSANPLTATNCSNPENDRYRP